MPLIFIILLLPCERNNSYADFAAVYFMIDFSSCSLVLFSISLQSVSQEWTVSSVSLQFKMFTWPFLSEPDSRFCAHQSNRGNSLISPLRKTLPKSDH